MDKLKFASGNSKMNALGAYLGLKNGQVVAFDLPAGYTCPNAKDCLAYAGKHTRKIINGKDQIFRCYAASLENVFKNYRLAHWHNYDILKKLNTDQVVSLILQSLPKNVKIVRVHSSGDFFSHAYFTAWVKVAESMPEIQFFGYTKILEYVTCEKPSNFKLVYSLGGKDDSKVTESIPTCKVVKYSTLSLCKDETASAQDYFSILAQKSFTLNLHGTQPKNCTLE